MDFERSSEQTAFLDRVEAFARDEVGPHAAAIDESDAFPRELVARAASLGLCGVTVPKAAGGAGLDMVSYALAIEAVGRASATLAVILSVNNSLVTAVVNRWGSAAQKDRWLTPLASGRALGAFALSEAQSGSDAGNQQTVASLDARGYVLNGRKVWVANAEAADVFVVFAATQPLARGRGISVFLV
nr:acyl-CoA dehydrogenase family protein [Acidobacteriota bacterium]